MTQLETLKAAFDRGESLTVAEALSKYGIYALSQRCGELARNYPIKTEMVEVGKATVAHGAVRTVRVARYSKDTEAEALYLRLEELAQP